MESNPYESPRQVGSEETDTAGRSSKYFPGVIFLAIVLGAFFIVVIADNWRAIVFASLFPVPIGAATLIYCRRWGFLLWGAAALLEALILYSTVIRWMESGFSW